MPDLFKGTEPPSELFDKFQPLMDPKPTDGCCSKFSAICTALYWIPGIIMRINKSAHLTIVTDVIDVLKKEKGIKKVGLTG